MKFEVSEIIKTKNDRAEILNALSNQFSKVSKSVLRQYNGFEVKRIEASFGSINRSDTSTISIQEKNEGYLLIADITYKTSIWFWIFFIIGLFTWIGWLLPVVFYMTQKNTVRKAVQDIFTRIKNEFQDNNYNINKVNLNSNSLDQLEKLHNLKEKGIITEEEFIIKKNELLKN